MGQPVHDNADYRAADRSYSAWLDAKCVEMNVRNYQFMDARGKEHMICMLLWERDKADTPSPKGINNGWDRPWHAPDWHPPTA